MNGNKPISMYFIAEIFPNQIEYVIIILNLTIIMSLYPANACV